MACPVEGDWESPACLPGSPVSRHLAWPSLERRLRGRLRGVRCVLLAMGISCKATPRRAQAVGLVVLALASVALAPVCAIVWNGVHAAAWAVQLGVLAAALAAGLHWRETLAQPHEWVAAVLFCFSFVELVASVAALSIYFTLAFHRPTDEAGRSVDDSTAWLMAGCWASVCAAVALASVVFSTRVYAFTLHTAEMHRNVLILGACGVAAGIAGMAYMITVPNRAAALWCAVAAGMAVLVAAEHRYRHTCVRDNVRPHDHTIVLYILSLYALKSTRTAAPLTVRPLADSAC